MIAPGSPPDLVPPTTVRRNRPDVRFWRRSGGPGQVHFRLTLTVITAPQGGSKHAKSAANGNNGYPKSRAPVTTRHTDD